MHIDFSSAIDNARFFAARHAAVRPHSAGIQLKSGRWGAVPSGDRPEVRARAALPAVNIKSPAGGRSVHAH